MAKIDFKLKNVFKKIKPEYIILIVAIVIIAVLFLSSFKTTEKQTSSVDEYVSMLENKLSARLSELDGAGKVRVIISVKRGLTTEVATEKKYDSGDKILEESPVLIAGKPLVLGEIYPEICGVIILAKGASDIKVKLSLLMATQTFLDIESDKIQVLSMR